MYAFSKNAVLHSAWRDRLARQQTRIARQQDTRFSYTTSDWSIRSKVASFVFINSTDRKEVNSHV